MGSMRTWLRIAKKPINKAILGLVNVVDSPSYLSRQTRVSYLTFLTDRLTYLTSFTVFNFLPPRRDRWEFRDHDSRPSTSSSFFSSSSRPSSSYTPSEPGTSASSLASSSGLGENSDSLTEFTNQLSLASKTRGDSMDLDGNETYCE
jgi:hypothetical protein